MAGDSLQEFLQETAVKATGQDTFEHEGKRCLVVALNGMVWTKMGSMVSYNGNVKFTREGIMEHGLGRLLKKAVTSEGMMLTKAEGQGYVYLADGGKQVSIIRLENQAITVNGNDVLAFEQDIQWDVKMMKKIVGMMQGGLFNVKLSGTGYVAITTHYDPITLAVKPGQPVFTDPNATVAWSSNLTPELKADISLKSFFGRGSGESFQMVFNGEGFVVVQPYEEIYMATTG